MDDIRVQSWQELNERLYDEAWQEDLRRFRSTYVFRGVPYADFDLRTSLIQMAGDCPPPEAHLLRSFRKYAQHEAVPGDSIWNWLALAQHHGLPTRLLDWTYSPYVALHFATKDLERFDTDAAIWCVDHTRTNRYLPATLTALLAEEGTTVFTAEMLSQVATTLPEFDAIDHEAFVLFLEPPSLDERIINQYALFSLMSSSTARLDRWLRRHPHAFRRLIIPAELKWEVRDKLDQANITERVLFPGLDGLSRWLKRYYTPTAGGHVVPPAYPASEQDTGDDNLTVC